jgi:hypothetical protein
MFLVSDGLLQIFVSKEVNPMNFSPPKKNSFKSISTISGSPTSKIFFLK